MFSKFYWWHFDSVSKRNVALKTLLLQGLSEPPEFYGDLVYKFRKIIIDKNVFSLSIQKDNFFVDALRQTACSVVNAIKVNSCAYLFECTTVGRALH